MGKLTEVPRPFICGVIWEGDPRAAAADMKLAECDGAQAFEVNIGAFRPEFRNVKALASVFRLTTLPIFTTFRRYGGLATDQLETLDVTDDERMGLQLDLIDVGSVAFDMELDTFDPVPGPPMNSEEGILYAMNPHSTPREVTSSPAAVEKQMRLIEEAHRRGGQVMASSHNLIRLPVEGALRICRLAEERTADAVKIVRFNQSWEDIAETLAATVALRRQARIPYIMMAMGEYGKLARLTAPLFGSMLCFCKQTYRPGTFTDQPLIRQARSFYESVDFKITRRAEEFTPEWFARQD